MRILRSWKIKEQNIKALKINYRNAKCFENKIQEL